MKRWMLGGVVLAIALSAPAALMAQNAAPPAPAAPPAQAADPAVLLKAIPEDAAAFVALRGLESLNQDIQSSVTALNFPPGTVPSITDLFKQGLRLGRGFDENGNIALVVLSLAQVTQPEEIENRLAFFFPATDADALVAAMGGTADGEIYKLEDFGGEPAIAATRENFVIIAKNETALQDALKARGDGLAKTMSPERLKAFGQQDIFGWLNFRSIPKGLRDSVRQSLEKEGNPALAGLAGSLDQLEQIVEQADVLSVALSLDPKVGITGNLFMSFRPDTEMGRQMAALKPPSDSLLLGLPNDPFILALGTMTTPDTERQFRQAMEIALSEDAIGEGVNKEQLTQLREGLVKLLSTVERISMGVYPLPVEDGQGMFNVAMVASVKNAEQWKQEAMRIYETGKAIAVDVAKQKGQTEEQIQPVADAVQWKKEAETLGGAKVDHLIVDLSKLPDADPESIDQAKKVLGPEGVLIRIGSLGQNRVILTFGGGAKRFGTIAQLAAAGEAPLKNSADIKKVANRLAQQQLVAEAYFNVDQLLNLIMDISSEVGGGFMFPIALRNAAPIAGTTTKVSDTAQQSEILIPMELIRSVSDVIRPMLMMGMQGGPGPQPGDSDEIEPPLNGPGLQ